MAIQDGSGVLLDASRWLEEILFELDLKKRGNLLVNEMNMAEQYVRFVQLDDRGRFCMDEVMVGLVRLLIDTWNIMKARCEDGERGGLTGWLYLRGMNVLGHELPLVGFYKPVERRKCDSEGLIRVQEVA